MMLLTVCKPKGSQAIKSIKETGDMGSFPLLHLGIGAKLQCVYICAYIYMFVTYMMASFELFFCCCCCSGLLSLLPYHVFQLSYVFHYKANWIADPSEKHCRSIPAIFMVVWWWEKSALVSSYLPPFVWKESRETNFSHDHWSLENMLLLDVMQQYT